MGEEELYLDALTNIKAVIDSELPKALAFEDEAEFGGASETAIEALKAIKKLVERF